MNVRTKLNKNTYTFPQNITICSVTIRFYKTLPAAPNYPQTVALDDANKKKNRYKNISACK